MANVLPDFFFSFGNADGSKVRSFRKWIILEESYFSSGVLNVPVALA